MNPTIQTIEPLSLALAFIPIVLVLFVFAKWSLDVKNAVYSLSRMLIQLLLVGYILTTIFAAESAWLIVLVMLVMVTASSWIALNVVKDQRLMLFKHMFISILVGGGFTLAIVTQLVLTLEPWFQPQYMVPLAGMIFANSMNTVSLAVERLHAEIERGVAYQQARTVALHASFIPIINSMFAVGLVALPGMMTGQILSGVSPLIAAQYQIVVMCMIFGSAGISAVIFLILSKKYYFKF
jgi:putative ABC transport system permease protein